MRSGSFLESPTPCTYLATCSGWPDAGSSSDFSISRPPHALPAGCRSPASHANSLQTLVTCGVHAPPAAGASPSGAASPMSGLFQVPSAQNTIVLGIARSFLARAAGAGDVPAVAAWRQTLRELNLGETPALSSAAMGLVAEAISGRALREGIVQMIEGRGRASKISNTCSCAMR